MADAERADAAVPQAEALSYLAHEVNGTPVGGWYRMAPPATLEVYSRGRLRRVPLAGRAPDETARDVLAAIAQEVGPGRGGAIH